MTALLNTILLDCGLMITIVTSLRNILISILSPQCFLIKRYSYRNLGSVIAREQSFYE
jgi:hypothetical protein